MSAVTTNNEQSDIMSHCVALLLISLIPVSVGQEAALSETYRRFVYQKDMSEYCRRNVMPSVFIGRQIVDANSQMLHFSRLEVPYSCNVNIRTDMGSNIIVVIQVFTDMDIKTMCGQSDNQLLIYELGETFGGYWGQVPDSVMKREPHSTEAQYTLTKPTETVPTAKATKSSTTATTTPATTKMEVGAGKLTDDGREYITLELPIVNVSAQFLPNKLAQNSLGYTNDDFELIYDVTPWSDENYDTKILPLLEVAVGRPKGKTKLRGEGSSRDADVGAEFQVHFDDLFTPDPRLTIPPFEIRSPKRKTKFDPSVNRRLNFKKNKQLFAARQAVLNKGRLFNFLQPQTNKLYEYLQSSTPQHNDNVDHKNNTWDVINDILKNLTNSEEVVTKPPHEELANILRKISMKELNRSAYLYPNLLETNSSLPNTIGNEHSYNSSVILELPKTVDTGYTNKLDMMLDLPQSVGTEDSYKLDKMLDLPKSIDTGHSDKLDMILDTPKTVVTENSYKLDTVSELTKTVVTEKFDKSNVTSQQPNNKTPIVTSNDTVTLKSRTQGISELFNSSNVLVNNDTAINDARVSVALLPIVLDVDSIILNGTNQNIVGFQYKPSETTTTFAATSSTKVTKIEPLTVAMVNHESWENVVKAAPIMAFKLNETTATTNISSGNQEGNVTKQKQSKVRKRRYMHAIDIEVAKPHPVQVMKYSTTTPPPEKFDLRDFQRLIELQDDEIHGRISMRYLKQFVGQPLLKLCEFNESASRHVYLFNSSRLVLALTNFTLNRMMVVVTPARTLLSTETRCAPAHLECQVSGARVCIDAHSACDGVPNCGSYDIYDEDRLNCGAAAGLSHNVCLAAITFLAVLLTILYTIHYWLKRCIPKVSDAFFIYTDAAENTLFLQPLMRSPHDVGAGKEYYHGNIPDYNMEYEDIVPKNKTCRTFLKRFLVFLRCFRKGHHSEVVELDNLYPTRISVFDVELNKITASTMLGHTVDVGVQTSASLDVGVINLTSSYNERNDTEIKDSISIENLTLMGADLDSNQPSDELSILQFFKRERTKSISSHINHIADVDLPEIADKGLSEVETEIESHMYASDRYNVGQDITLERPRKIVAEVYSQKTEAVNKHLRFHDEAMIIPSRGEEELDDENIENAQTRKSSVLPTNRGLRNFRIQDTNDDNNEDEPSAGTGREFKSYFNWGKERKKKKPKKK